MAAPIRKIVFSLFHRHYQHSQIIKTAYGFCTNTAVSENTKMPSLLTEERKITQSSKIQKINKAMKAYLEQAKQYSEFMEKEEEDFEIGKRHLANMMGVDPNMFTQEDIDKAIEYLMPSALYEKKARPMMKHPKEIFPAKKEAQFDISGRPHHPLFYTRYPNYYQAMYNLAEKIQELDSFEDKMIQKGILYPPDESKLELESTEWIKKIVFEGMIIEPIRDDMYNNFIATLNRLAEHPYAFRVKDVIMQYRAELKIAMTAADIPPLQYTESGRPYITREGFRKTSTALVTVYGEGTGKFTINGTDLEYFQIQQDRVQLLFPLQFTDLLNKVDVEASVAGLGDSSQSGAIRHGLSLAISSFVTKEMVEKMRLAGLLLRDRRTRERKKTGQPKARKKRTWKKR